jgi:hypothetical protein
VRSCFGLVLALYEFLSVENSDIFIAGDAHDKRLVYKLNVLNPYVVCVVLVGMLDDSAWRYKVVAIVV